MSTPTRAAIAALVAFAVASGVVLALMWSGRLDGGSGPTAAVTSVDQIQGTFASDGGSLTPTPLVEGTPVQLVFSGDQVGANAGCNQMSGSVSVDGGHLVVDHLVSTMMACQPDAVMAQEAWVRSMLEARPSAELDGDRLTLRWEGYRLALTRRTRPAPTESGASTSTQAPSRTTPVQPTVQPTFVPGPTPPLATRPTVGPGAVGTDAGTVGPSMNTIPESPQAPSP